MQIGDNPKITVRLENWDNGACHWRLSIGQPFERVDPLIVWGLRLALLVPEDATPRFGDKGIFKNDVIEWIEVKELAGPQMALPV